jgi:multidrug efflux system outer membrane protein
LFELEAARRDAVQSRSALIELQRERVASWIALYRALGGGWVPDGASAVAER